MEFSSRASIWNGINLQVYRFFTHRCGQNKRSPETRLDDLSGSVFGVLVSQCRSHLLGKSFAPTTRVHNLDDVDMDVAAVKSSSNPIDPHETIGNALLLHLLTKCTHQRIQKQQNVIDENMRILNTLETVSRDLEGKELWTRTRVRKVIGEEESLVELQQLLYEEFAQYEASCAAMDEEQVAQEYLLTLHAQAAEIQQLRHRIMCLEREVKQSEEEIPPSSKQDGREENPEKQRIGDLFEPSMVELDPATHRKSNQDILHSDVSTNTEISYDQLSCLQNKFEGKKNEDIKILIQKSNEQELRLRSLNLQLMGCNSHNLSREYSTICSLQDQVKGLTNELSQVREEKDHLSVEVAAEKERLIRASNLVTDYQSDHKMLASIRAENIQLVSELEKTRNMMKQEEGRQKQKLRQAKCLKNRVNSTSNAIKEERNRSRTLQKRILELETELAQTKELARANQNQVSMLQKKTDEASSQTSQERIKRCDAEQKASVFETNMRVLETELTSLKATNEKLTNLCLAKNQSLNEFEQKGALLELKNRLLQQSIDGPMPLLVTKEDPCRATASQVEVETVIEIPQNGSNCLLLKPFRTKVSEYSSPRKDVMSVDISIITKRLEKESNCLIAGCCRVLDQYDSRMRSLQLSMSKLAVQNRHQDRGFVQDPKTINANPEKITQVKRQESYEMTTSSASQITTKGFEFESGRVLIGKSGHYAVPNYRRRRFQGSKMRKPTPIASTLLDGAFPHSCLRCYILRQVTHASNCSKSTPKSQDLRRPERDNYQSTMRWKCLTLTILLHFQMVERRIVFWQKVGRAHQAVQMSNKTKQLSQILEKYGHGKSTIEAMVSSCFLRWRDNVRSSDSSQLKQNRQTQTEIENATISIQKKEFEECLETLKGLLDLLCQNMPSNQQTQGGSSQFEYLEDTKQLKRCCVIITRKLECHLRIRNKEKSLLHTARKEVRQLRELNLINERLITQMEKRGDRKQAELKHAFALLCTTIQKLQENPKPSNLDQYKQAMQCFGHILNGDYVSARTTCNTHPTIKTIMLKIQKEQAQILQITHRQLADGNIKLLQDAVRVLKQARRVNEQSEKTC